MLGGQFGTTQENQHPWLLPTKCQEHPYPEALGKPSTTSPPKTHTHKCTHTCTHTHICNHSLEKAMAPHSSTLAWKIPWTEEPGRLQSTGSLRVGHDWVNSLSLFTFMHWRMKWQPTPVFLPGESQGQGSLVGCCLWDRRESDTTEVDLAAAAAYPFT